MGTATISIPRPPQPISVPIALQNRPKPIQHVRLILWRGSRGAKMLRIRLHSTDRNITSLGLHHIAIIRQPFALARSHVLRSPEFPPEMMVHPGHHELEILRFRALFTHEREIDVQKGVSGHVWWAGPKDLVRDICRKLGVDARVVRDLRGVPGCAGVVCGTITWPARSAAEIDGW